MAINESIMLSNNTLSILSGSVPTEPLFLDLCKDNLKNILTFFMSYIKSQFLVAHILTLVLALTIFILAVILLKKFEYSDKIITKLLFWILWAAMVIIITMEVIFVISVNISVKTVLGGM